jgi:hypothetical protein
MDGLVPDEMKFDHEDGNVTIGFPQAPSLRTRPTQAFMSEQIMRAKACSSRSGIQGTAQH